MRRGSAKAHVNVRVGARGQRLRRLFFFRGTSEFGDGEAAQHGLLFFLVQDHTLLDADQETDGVDNIGALVEHDALGASAHSGVGDFGAGRQTFLGKSFEDLSGPDGGDVSGFAEPEHFFLDFGHAFKPHFDCQIATSEHDANRRSVKGGQPDTRGARQVASYERTGARGEVPF